MSAWAIVAIIVAGWALLAVTVVWGCGKAIRTADQRDDDVWDDHCDQALSVANYPQTPHAAMEWTALDEKQMRRWAGQ